MSVKPTNIPKCHLRQSADSAGNFSRHGKLGEVTGNIRTFVLPYENGPYTFGMSFEYDSWNRIQNMTYPDGEVVVYGYNSGGMLSSMTGAKNGLLYKYIDSIRYNEFELKAAMYYGNGTKTFYKYDILQRLDNLQSYTAATTTSPSEIMQDIYYKYDSVSNIIDITNYAGTLLNGLGGKYGNTYKYNNLYRLEYSEGTWYGNHPVGYKLNMEYTPNGRIMKKYLDADTYTQTPFSSNQSPVLYQNDYHYTNNNQPNTLTHIDNSPHQDFKWDVKGNLTFHYNENVPFKRFLCWDEQNRLLGVKDDKFLSYYQYDANGDRIYKLTGEFARQNRNGEWRYFYYLKRPTLYASPYLVTNPKGYTKHYYAENERIASRMGGGGLYDIDRNDNPEMFVTHKERSIKLFAEVMECLETQAEVPESLLKFLYEWKDIREEEKECYWYHPDHLGSSSWITFFDGKAVEHLHYMPWGEDFIRQRSTDWHAMYTFSAKEKDQETGFSYFGSRYYSSDLSIWLSVDPQASKYPHQSNYVYCSNNPIKVIDPNGEDEYEFDEYGCYIRTITNTQADIIHIVNGDGERTASSQSFSYGSVISQPNNDVPSNNSTLPDATMFQVVDEGTASAIFEFFSENTSVEWGNVSAETKDNGCEYTIGTNHMEGKNNISAIVTNQGAVVDRSVHNHPNDINSVSEGDHRGAILLEQINPNVQLFNYTRSHGYTQYNRNTGYVDKNGVSHYPTLREVIIDKKP